CAYVILASTGEGACAYAILASTGEGACAYAIPVPTQFMRNRASLGRACFSRSNLPTLLCLGRYRLLCLSLLLRTEQRKQNHISDGGRVRQQHGQAVNAESNAAGRRQYEGEGAYVILVHAVSFLVAALSLPQLLLEAAALLLGIVQLAEAIGDLHASGKDLETFHPLRF